MSPNQELRGWGRMQAFRNWLIGLAVTVVAVYILVQIVNAEKTKSDFLGVLFACFIFGFPIYTFICIGMADWQSSHKRKLALQVHQNQLAAYQSRPQELINTEIRKLPNFVLTNWWGSPAAPNSAGIEGVAIALDEAQEKLALIEYYRPSDKVVTRLLNARDIIEATVEEQGYVHSQTTMQSTVRTQQHASTGSMIGRAVVGGVLLGPAGAIIGGATARRTGYETMNGTQQTVHIDVVTTVALKLLVNDTRSPVFLVNFLPHHSAKNAAEYQKAVEAASYWHGVLGVLKHRAG